MSNQSLKEQLAAALAKVNELESANKTAQAELESAKQAKADAEAKAAKAKEPKAPKKTRIGEVINALKAGITGHSAVIAEADKTYGKSNDRETKWAFNMVRQTLVAGGLATDDGKDIKLVAGAVLLKAEEPKADEQSKTEEQPKADEAKAS